MLCPCCVHTVVVLTRKGGAYVRGVGQISACVTDQKLCRRRCVCPERLAELFMRAQYPVSPVEPTLLLLCNLVLYDEQWRNPGFMFAWQKEVCLLCGG